MSEAENQNESNCNLVVKGKSCVEGESQQLERTYQVGKNLNNSISSIGQPDTSVTFFESNFDSDSYCNLWFATWVHNSKKGRQRNYK